MYVRVYTYNHTYIPSTNFLSAQLTQRQALEHLLTNFTWLRQVPDQASFPDDSIQKSVLENWGNTSIFLSLILFILFHVS